MNWLFKAFDAFMIRKGRKLTLADTWGNIILHRYCLLRREEPEEGVRGRKIGDRPNVYLHHFVWPFAESPDGPARHNHVASTLSLVLRGRYREWYDGKVRDRRPGTVTLMKWPKPHKIEWVQPNTWTIFVMWFARDTSTTVFPETCEDVCQWCATNNGGVCFNESKLFKYDAYSKQFDSAKPNGKKFAQWAVAGPVFDAWLARRRRVVQRMKVETPVGAQALLKHGRQTSKLPLMDAEVK